MSWLSDRTGVHWNLRPLAAPVGGIVGGMLGGPLGAALGAGLFKTADNKAHGDGWEHALGQGALNGALAYGTAGLMGGGGRAASAAGSVEPDMTNALASPDVQRSVMQRVMGGAGEAARGAGSFVKNNHELLTTAGSAAQGILGAAAQNRQGSIAQQQADAETAQSNEAIRKQKAIQDAFAKMYGQGLPMQGTPTLPSAPGMPSRALSPSGRTFSPDEIPGGPGSVGSGGDGPPQITQPGNGTGGPQDQPGTAADKTKLSVLARMGYILPPSSDYAGNSSTYGSPYGSGYSSQSYFGGY